MGPEQSAEGEERLRLEDVPFDETRRREIGDRLESAARARLSRRRWSRAAAAAVVAALVVVVAARFRASVPLPVASDAHLRTGVADFQLLSLGDRGVAFVSEQSDVELRPGMAPTLLVHRGSVRLIVRHHQGQPFVVGTPAAEVQVVGTEFDVTVTGDATEVSVVRGEVEVRNAHGRRRLWPRESARASAGQAPKMVTPVKSVVEDGPAEIVTPPGR